MTLTCETVVVNKGDGLHALSVIRQLPTAELAIRDVCKPIGVATYKTDRSVPSAYRRLVPLMKGVNEILEDW